MGSTHIATKEDRDSPCHRYESLFPMTRRERESQLTRQKVERNTNALEDRFVDNENIGEDVLELRVNPRNGHVPFLASSCVVAKSTSCHSNIVLTSCLLGSMSVTLWNPCGPVARLPTVNILAPLEKNFADQYRHSLWKIPQLRLAVKPPPALTGSSKSLSGLHD